MEPIQLVKIVLLLDNAVDEHLKWENPLGKSHKGKAEKAFEVLSKVCLEFGHPQSVYYII